MGTSPLLKLLVITLLAGIKTRSSDPGALRSTSLLSIPLHGQFTFDDISKAATDFGNRVHHVPSAVLHPGSVADVAATTRRVFQLGPNSKLTIAARGRGHSLHGQAQAPDGIVVRMESLRRAQTMWVHTGQEPYVDAPGGELWIDLLRETLKQGLAPKSWTDYLHLTVGGTLSNAGISGQAFRHGPQISNVRQLEVVTGKGDIMNCSAEANADLYHAVLGGLGQFGIIIRARIELEPAPKMVKWMRVLYSDFRSFTEDQEMLISAENTFDYIEGFVIINRSGILRNWGSSFSTQFPAQASQFVSEGKTLFCLEMAKNFDPTNPEKMKQEMVELLSRLRYIPYTLFKTEVSYLEFLDRLHSSERKLRSKGLWEVPRPWLNLLVPRSSVHFFADNVFGKIITDTSNGPILLYPMNRSNWDNRTSAVIPNEDVFYLVAFLSSTPASSGQNSFEAVLKQNEKILKLCESANIQTKQYLPHYTKLEEWRDHFGSRWEAFQRRKQDYDPLAILAPGHRIFHKAMA
ncbi:hypothetical protein HPP92_006435 [Vanilla planifolia]|uniref:cytokinin dehydrogenase n=1 Tax=Vanilla planifolia TaxID=51239 RepID=A0A835RPB2_VANPL|nr:hypothetical protein HPP92_006435 [Vanilla planifolia]